MINELSNIILEHDLPEIGLKTGDIGTVVMVHEGGVGYEIEFCELDGVTVDVVTLDASQIRAVRSGEVAYARPLTERTS